MKILITGGARSGKSLHALGLGRSLGTSRTYVATARTGDEEMEQRVRHHQAERGQHWKTVEEPLDIIPLLDSDEVVLVDCLTLWLSNLMMREEDGAEEDHDGRMEARFDALCQALDQARNHVILVTNEVGLGVAPMTYVDRRFRDLTGTLSQQVAARCSDVVLMCAGIPLTIKGQPGD